MSAPPIVVLDRSRLSEEIKILKADERGIIPSRRSQMLRRIELMETELGRMQKLLNELRADALHLTTE